MPTGVTNQAQAVLDGWGAAWNADDLDAMARLFAPDVHWVKIVGMHWQGREAVALAHRAYLERVFRGVDQQLDAVQSVTSPPGAAAVVAARIRMSALRTPDGAMQPAGLDWLTLVLMPDQTGLLIAHGADVPIVEEAQRFHPVVLARSGNFPAKPG